jgi:hypothetical protein
MELKDFLGDLVSSLARVDFVASVDLHTEVFTVKGRVYFKDRGFLEVYFNELTQTVAVQPFPVIKQERLRRHRHRLVESKMALVSTGSVAWKQAQPAEAVQSRRRPLVGKPLAAVVPQSG